MDDISCKSAIFSSVLQKALALFKTKVGVQHIQIKEYKNLTKWRTYNLLIQWFHQMRLENYPINGSAVQDKASEVALRLKIDSSLTLKWFTFLKKFHGMPCMSVCDESVSVNEDIVEHWKISLSNLLQG